jgi:hypothetical protein
MALLTERCLFINFQFYHKAFASELDFDWGRHQQRLLSFGHNVTKMPPYAVQVYHHCPAAKAPAAKACCHWSGPILQYK